MKPLHKSGAFALYVLGIFSFRFCSVHTSVRVHNKRLNTFNMHYRHAYTNTGWLRLVGSLQLQVSFAKEPYKRDYILQKRPIILRSLLIVAIQYRGTHCLRPNTYMGHHASVHLDVATCHMNTHAYTYTNVHVTSISVVCSCSRLQILVMHSCTSL